MQYEIAIGYEEDGKIEVVTPGMEVIAETAPLVVTLAQMARDGWDFKGSSRVSIPPPTPTAPDLVLRKGKTRQAVTVHLFIWQREML